MTNRRKMDLSSPATPQRIHFQFFLLLAAASWMAFCLWLTGPSRPPGIAPGKHLGWYFASFLGYFPAAGVCFLLSRRISRFQVLFVIFAFALALRLVVFFRKPLLSTDIYRYIWDGRMAAQGVNPYLYPPADEKLIPYRNEIWKSINYKPIPTIYPPLAQMVFAALYRISPDNIALFRAFFTLLDLACAGMLIVLLQQLRRPISLAAVYAWNPLAVSEFASAGHVDSLGLFLWLACLSLWLKGERTASGALLGLSTMAKGFSLIGLPFLLRRGGIRFFAAFLAVCLLCVSPYLGAGKALFAGLYEYTKGWEANPGLFLLIKSGLRTSLSSAQADLWSRLLLAGFFIFALAWLVRKAGKEESLLLCNFSLALAFFFLFSPTVFPWYLSWLAAFLSLSFSPALLLWTATVSLHYVRIFADFAHSSIWLYAEYLPVGALLTAEFFPPGIYRKPEDAQRTQSQTLSVGGGGERT